MLTHERVEDTIRLQSIRSILPSLPSDPVIWSISPEASVSDAMERMTANNIGALVVLSAQKLDGIVTREDVRETTLQGRDAGETRVSEIMTRGVYYATPAMTIDKCMLLMSSRRLRYLPVLDGISVLSMISIDDILDRVTRQSLQWLPDWLEEGTFDHGKGVESHSVPSSNFIPRGESRKTGFWNEPE